MGMIKKYWYIVLLIIILIIVAIIYFMGKNEAQEANENKIPTENKKILSYSEDYFYNHVNIDGTDEYNITIEMLKNAVALQLANYDMNELEKCEDTSYATFTLKKGETTVEKIESHFICQ